MKLLVTGGTVFVSRFTAEWFSARGHQVTVLNRGNRPQPKGTQLLCADRHHLKDALQKKRYDAVLDICAYTAADVNDLLDGLGEFGSYLLISSSAVYPDTLPQPFREEQPVGPNAVWGAYGLNKIAAEQALLARVPDACILRPPYLYGPMQNLYREPFVFDCAMAHRPFNLPGKGSLPLQFFHVEDLCRVMERILQTRPAHNIYNVGNPETVTARQWVELCYQAAGERVEFRCVEDWPNQRDSFCFHDYAYRLDVSRQQTLLQTGISLAEGLCQSFDWYKNHPEEVTKKPYRAFLDSHF